MTAQTEFAVEVSGLNFFYGSRQVLKNIEIAILPGETIGILGPNGSGKSTLLRLLTGVIPPPPGSKLDIMRKSLAALKARERAKLTAFVPQSEEHFFDFKVRDLVLMGRFPHSDGLYESAADIAIADRAMETTDCLEYADRPISTLSGGEAQRVFIARALAQEAPVLICDEPTTHLDTVHQIEIAKTLVKLKSNGQTTVIATHDLNLANQVCDRVYLLKAGEIVYEGALIEATNQGELESVFGTQFKIVENYIVPQF